MAEPAAALRWLSLPKFGGRGLRQAQAPEQPGGFGRLNHRFYHVSRFYQPQRDNLVRPYVESDLIAPHR